MNFVAYLVGCISNFRSGFVNDLSLEEKRVMTKEEFLALAAQRYDELQALNKLDNFYDYEKQFVGIWKDLGGQVLEQNIGELPKDKRKKKDADHHHGTHHH